MNGFCSGRCNRFLLCTLILCSPTAEAASSAGELTGLLSFGALLTCLERFFLLYWINLSLGIIFGIIFVGELISTVCDGLGWNMGWFYNTNVIVQNNAGWGYQHRKDLLPHSTYIPGSR